MAKKSIKTILLSLGVALLTPMFAFGLHEDKASVSSAISFNKIETTAFVQILDWNDKYPFIINFSEASFTESSAINYDTYKTRFDALDFASHIYINGESMSFDNFNSNGFKFSTTELMGFNQVPPEIGQFLFCIVFESGKDFSDISIIEIDKGTLFPSPSYLTGSSNDVYSIASKLTASRAPVNWDWINYMESDVCKINTVDNTYLGLTLTVSDYPNSPFRDGQVGDDFTNYAGYITMDNNVTISNATYGLFCYVDTPKSIWPQTVGNPNTCSEITISKGLILKSYHSFNSQPAWPIYFKCVNDAVFRKINSAWVKVEQTSVTGMGFNANGYLHFILSNNDYPEVGDVVGNSETSFNNFKNIINLSDIGLTFANTPYSLWSYSPYADSIAPYVTGTLSNGDVLIQKGTLFPSYKYSFGLISYPLVYEVSKNVMFHYNGNAFISKNERTSVTAVVEYEPEKQNSIISFTLSENDYSGIQGGSVNVFELDSDEFNSLNFASYITINGKRLNELEGYGEDAINISNNGTISLRTPGNNTGYYYVDELGQRVYTEDLSKYEISIARGCQFPSFNSLIESSDDYDFYSTTEDISFALFDGRYVIEDHNFIEPSYIENTIKSVNYLSVTMTDICIYFRFTINDWPNVSIIADKDIQSQIACADFLNKIEIIDVNGDAHTPSTREVFVNIWGTAPVEASIGFRTNLAITDIKSIVIHEDCAFPTYENYLNEEDNSWYKFHETKFYSSRDNSFYLGTGLTANQYASEFNSAFSAVCSGYDGYSSNKVALEKKFYAFKNIYDEELSNAVKAQLKPNSGDIEIESMIETYSFVVAKYGLTDFLDLEIETINNKTFYKTLDTDGEAMQLTLIIVLVAVPCISLCLILFLKRRRNK